MPRTMPRMSISQSHRGDSEKKVTDSPQYDADSSDVTTCSGDEFRYSDEAVRYFKSGSNWNPELQRAIEGDIQQCLEFRSRMQNIKVADPVETEKTKAPEAKRGRHKEKKKELKGLVVQSPRTFASHIIAGRGKEIAVIDRTGEYGTGLQFDSRTKHNTGISTEGKRSDVFNSTTNRSQLPIPKSNRHKENMGRHVTFDTRSSCRSSKSSVSKSSMGGSSSSTSKESGGSWTVAMKAGFSAKPWYEEDVEERQSSCSSWDDGSSWSVPSSSTPNALTALPTKIISPKIGNAPVEVGHPPVEARRDEWTDTWTTTSGSDRTSSISTAMASGRFNQQPTRSESSWDISSTSWSVRSDDDHDTIVPYSWRREAEDESVYSNAGSTDAPVPSEAASRTSWGNSEHETHSSSRSNTTSDYKALYVEDGSNLSTSWGGDIDLGDQHKLRARSRSSTISNYQAPRVEDGSDSHTSWGGGKHHGDGYKPNRRSPSSTRSNYKPPYVEDGSDSTDRRRKSSISPQKPTHKPKDKKRDDSRSDDGMSTTSWGGSLQRSPHTVREKKSRDRGVHYEDKASTAWGRRYRMPDYSTPTSWRDV